VEEASLQYQFSNSPIAGCAAEQRDMVVLLCTYFEEFMRVIIISLH